MDDEPRRRVGSGPLPVVRDEADILRLALEVAARLGDPSPKLIEHTNATREAATKTTGSWVRSDEPSYLIAMRGDFSAARPSPPRSPIWASSAEEELISYTVQVLVVDVASGRITDSGSSADYPDLASVGPVLVDYRDSRLE